MGGGRALGQCPVGTASPAYEQVPHASVTEYFQSISASGSGVTSTIAVSGVTTYTNSNFDYSSTEGITAVMGSTVDIAITRYTTTYTAYLSVYVDWDGSNTYTAGELVGTVHQLSNTPTLTDVYSFVVPGCATPGFTARHMRIMLSEATGNAGAPCYANWGQSYDFYLTVVCPTVSVSGTATVCQGSTTALSSNVDCGSWSSSTPSVATVSASGVVTGILGGTATIAYTTPTCGMATTVVTVYPSPITGGSEVCVGHSTTLTSATPSGTWASSDPSVASVTTATSATMPVTGMGIGTAVITYFAMGCYTTRNVSVANSIAITGSSVVCRGANITLTAATTSPTWTSSNTSIATVSATGVVHGASGGTATITCTAASGCIGTRTITVEAPVITGSSLICAGGAYQHYTSSITGGTWSSSTPSVASINPVSGWANGVSVGSTTISYISLTGCLTTQPVTVRNQPTISGSTSVCTGALITLSHTLTGGAWHSSNTGVAGVNSGGVVTGGSVGVSTISYTVAGCVASWPVVVSATPSISGSSSVVCGASISLTSIPPYGTWSTGTPGVATVNSSGVVTGVSAGGLLITRTSLSGCKSTMFVYVNAPVITGAGGVCIGSTISLSADVAGGVWSSTNSGRATVDPSTGVVTGVAAGTVTIQYTYGACLGARVIDVGAPQTITGPSVICNSSSGHLSATPPGTWSSSNSSIAAVNTSGDVTAVSSGSATIYYVTSIGCVSSYAVHTEALSITGPDRICEDFPAISYFSGASYSTIYHYSASPSGGSWATSNTSIATINSSTGEAHGHSPNVVTISYTTGTPCTVNKFVTVDETPHLIIFTTLDMHIGNSVSLYGHAPGGTWSSANSIIASVVGGGVTSAGGYSSQEATVTGNSVGSVIMNYTFSHGANSCVLPTTVNVFN